MNTVASSHAPPRRRDTAWFMRQTLYALLPGTVLAVWLLGPGVAINVGVAISLAIACEALAVCLRGRAVRRALGDGSIVLAAWLLALCLPPVLPLAMLAFAVGMMVFVGKHLYGGLGQNPFNPAMVGYVAVLVSFPASMSVWLGTPIGPSIIEPIVGMASPAIPDPASAASSRFEVWWLAKWRGDTSFLFDAERGYVTNAAVADSAGPSAPSSDPAPVGGRVAATASQGETPADAPPPDALTGATPLDRLRTAEHWLEATTSPTRGVLPRSPDRLLMQAPSFTVSLGFLAGGLYLLARGVIAWRVPVAVLGSLAFWHGVHRPFETVPEPSAWVAALAGGAVLGAFFIATDPVSGASGPRGKLVYGIGIGTIAFAIREYGAYPEGIAFGVLLMNAAVPLIDDRLVQESRR